VSAIETVVQVVTTDIGGQVVVATRTLPSGQFLTPGQPATAVLVGTSAGGAAFTTSSAIPNYINPSIANVVVSGGSTTTLTSGEPVPTPGADGVTVEQVIVGSAIDTAGSTVPATTTVTINVPGANGGAGASSSAPASASAGGNNGQQALAQATGVNGAMKLGASHGMSMLAVAVTAFALL